MNDQNSVQQPFGDAPQPQAVPQPQQPFEAAAQPMPQQPFGAAPQPQQPYAGSYQQPFGVEPVAPPAGYNPYAQPGYGAAGFSQPPASTSKATAALVLGIAAIAVCVFVPILGAPLGIALGIAAIVMGGSYIKVNGPFGRAKAGRICGIVGLVLSILSLLFTIALGALLGFVGMDLYDDMAMTDVYEIIDEFDGGGYGEEEFFNGAIVPGFDDAAPFDEGSLTEAETLAVEAVSYQFDLLTKGDSELLQSIGAIADEGFYEATGVHFADCGIDSLDYARAVTQGVTYVISEVSLEGDYGYVAAYVNCKDIFEINSVVYEALEELASAPGAEAMSDEEYNQRAGEILMAAVNEAAVVPNCNWAIIDVECPNGEWSILGESWDFEMEYMFSIA